jgi:S-formylglutathione hydrolase FrmB
MTKSKLYLLCLVSLLSCINAKQVNGGDLYPEKINGWVLNKVFDEKAFDTSYTITLKGIKYNIQFKVPRNNKQQLILFLPGWNLPASDWKTKTKVVDSALSLGYSTLLVDMGKSVYLDTFYSNTRADYKNYPTRQWLWEEVLEPYRDAGFFSDVYKGLKSHVFGLSTGARGAVALAQDHYLTVNFVAALSGDYNPLIDTTDALMINSMGRYYQNTDRWRFGSNNLLQRGAISGHLYLAHGKKDRVVPIKHSLEFADSLLKGNSIDQGWPVYTFFPESSGHDYLFWNEAGLKALNQLRVLYP